MQVFLQIVAFSLQNDWSGRPVLAKGKRPQMANVYSFVPRTSLLTFGHPSSEAKRERSWERGCCDDHSGQ